MREDELLSALRKGTRRAVRQAAAWSTIDFWPGDSGAENLLQVCIAQAIYEECPVRAPAIFLELTLNRFDEGRFNGDLRRVDIALRYRTTPNWMSVIEIKKYPGDFTADLVKIRDVLERLEGVRYAYLLTYFQKFEPHLRGRRKLETQMSAAADKISDQASTVHGLGCRSDMQKPLGALEDADGRWRCGVMASRFSRA